MKNRRDTIKLIIGLSALSAITHLEAGMVRTVNDTSLAPIVTLTVSPIDPSHAYVVEDKITGAALPTEISEDGIYDAATGKVKWGPFVDGDSRILSYKLAGEFGEAELDATLSSNGISETDAFSPLQINDPRTHFLGTLYLSSTVRDFVESLQFDSSEGEATDPFGLFLQYAFPDEKAALKLNAEGLFDGSMPRVSFMGIIRADALDLEYTIEISYDFEHWLPIEQAIPAAGQAMIEPSSTTGLNIISYMDVPIDQDTVIYARIQAERR